MKFEVSRFSPFLTYVNRSRFTRDVLYMIYYLQNFRYRFRLINAEFLNCPIEISVDNHTLLVISSDGRDIEPVQGRILYIFSRDCLNSSQIIIDQLYLLYRVFLYIKFYQFDDSHANYVIELCNQIYQSMKIQQ